MCFMALIRNTTDLNASEVHGVYCHADLFVSTWRQAQAPRVVGKILRAAADAWALGGYSDGGPASGCPQDASGGHGDEAGSGKGDERGGGPLAGLSGGFSGGGRRT